ncbi:Serine phosphatase RsbU, regulator of sigma subunit [Marivirga sericea]|uniref:Serine phosphatase RsbU, regulator of sigma subunit n=1 Tax=Marivirga sericea TaxID=1028 RepID=A0A1X7L3Y6_9BACT|nr:tetratricopeptide repeat protein [Marivirga sericea]SMG48576.1 Serine phosphatase RsbU, regulator of sigma subunit [Marivirga sericea]
MKNNLLVILLLVFCFKLSAQNSEVDSLLAVAESSNDSVKTKVYLDLAVGYRSVQPNTALKYVNEALKIADRNENYDQKASSLHILGAVYTVLGDYEKAIANLLESLRIYELLGDSKGVANSSNSLGILYFNQEDYASAETYYSKALSLIDSSEYAMSTAVYKLNIGEVYQATGDNEKALKLEEEAFKIFDQLADVNGMAYALGIQGKVNFQIGNEEKAIKLTKQALQYLIDDQDYLGAVEYLNFLVKIYLSTGNLFSAEENASTALEIAHQINSTQWKIKSFENLAQIFYKKQSFQQAYQYKDSAYIYENQLMDQEKQKQIENLRIIYESEQKEQENEILRIDKELKQKQIAQQRILNIAIGSVLVILIIFAIVTFRAKNHKQKANNQLKIQNEEIRQQREEIETQAERLKAINTDVVRKNQLIQEKNKNITDSINYAKRIQTALLPFPRRIGKELEDFFIYYKPKDIVSGDFYWFSETTDKVVVAVADCTGHGIPGAFMSFIGHDMLNHIVNFKGVTKPAEILKQLKLSVIHILRQEQSDNRDGMDVSICVWDKKKNAVEFSGANHSLIYIQNKQLYQIKGNKTTMGLDEGKNVKDFRSHEISLVGDTCFYLFSDGYVDQFGGEKDKKFMIKNFRELLSSIHMKHMETQGIIIRETIEDWMQEAEQVDDMLVLGFRIFS